MHRAWRCCRLVAIISVFRNHRSIFWRAIWLRRSPEDPSSFPSFSGPRQIDAGVDSQARIFGTRAYNAASSSAIKHCLNVGPNDRMASEYNRYFNASGFLDSGAIWPAAHRSVYPVHSTLCVELISGCQPECKPSLHVRGLSPGAQDRSR